MNALRHELKAEMVPVSSLVPWARNPRVNDAAAERLAYTIQTHGWTTPLLVQAGTNRIIGGHTRLKAALKLGLAEVPAVFLDVDDQQADAIAIADNRLGELAEWDADELGALLRELDEAGADIAAIGYTDDDLAALLDALDADEDPPDDPGPSEPPAEPDSEEGAVYMLGDHWLACGDNQDERLLATLLDGVTLGAVVTDPPYGIDASRFKMGANDPAAHARVAGMSGGSRWDDAAPDVMWLLDMAPLACLWGGNYFAGLPPSADWLVWDKKMRGLSFADGEMAWTNYGCRVRVLDHHWSGEKKEHITQKPLLVMEWSIGFTPAGCVVFDPYAGSGTTLIAAARTGRIARVMERDPGYCDVIRRRWTRYAIAAGIDPGPGALHEPDDG